MKKQKTMLLGALVLLRKSLRNLDAIVPKLRELGARHLAYGAKPNHYGVVGATLITSLATIAGDDWRPEHETAWNAAFGVVRDDARGSGAGGARSGCLRSVRRRR
jgi:hemoglobin-like flavoprotein